MSRGWDDDGQAGIDIDDDMRRYGEPLLACAAFEARLLPPGGRGWLEGFVVRCLEQAFFRGNRRSARAQGDFGRFWEILARDLMTAGVVRTVADMARLVHDADGKETRRGWAWTARHQAWLFLQDRDVRDVLETAIATTDAALWARYPGWFGSATPVAHYRARAARFLPHYRWDPSWLPPLLNDQTPEVRHIAAMHIAHDWPVLVDATVLARLAEAALDTDWLWSLADNHNSGRDGSETALLALNRLRS